MEELFAKLYGGYIKEIHDFLNSNTDILYISGYSGSGKSSVLKTALKNYERDILKFHHLCFRGTVADDFLLSFYDTFRNYAIRKKIVLKKNPEEVFMDKVSFYFKNLELPSVVIIDNFETAANEDEITDFLIHISGFENVKVIIISKNPGCSLTENPTVSLDRIFFEKINIFEFEEVLTGLFENADSSLIKDLYEATDGYELYLKMALTYLDSTFVTLSEFIEDFKEKEISFGDFMVNKQISLIPNNYYPLLQNLAYIYHNVSANFVEEYSLGDIKQFSYLISKFALSEFWGTYYIKSYLRKYFSENIEIQSKVAICNKLISVYENELKKSPKDRILRLSRESIRKQIVFLTEVSPKVAQINFAPAFSYRAQAISNNPSWFTADEKNKMKGMSGLKKKRELRQLAKKENNNRHLQEEKPSLLETIVAEAVKFEEEYRYKEAIDKLTEAKPLTKTLSEKIDVYSKIAHNAVKLNNNNLSLSILREICEICISEGNTDMWAKYRIETGKIYKKLYAFSRAKTCFEEIIKKEEYITKKTNAASRLALGEIYELENNFEYALQNFNAALDLILDEDKNDVLIPEIYYRLASLYDENDYFEEALIEYKHVIEYSKTSGNELYLLKSYTNSGVILADAGENKEALNNLKTALDISDKADNHTDTCYIARNIAGIYRNSEPEESYKYLTLALEHARLSENSFETAISLLELGDYYYDTKQNEQALICYFQAKTSLGSSASKENTQRITTRINDMKIKLGDYIFRGMKELYDPDGA